VILVVIGVTGDWRLKLRVVVVDRLGWIVLLVNGVVRVRVGIRILKLVALIADGVMSAEVWRLLRTYILISFVFIFVLLLILFLTLLLTLLNLFLALLDFLLAFFVLIICRLSLVVVLIRTATASLD